jgi:integrase
MGIKEDKEKPGTYVVFYSKRHPTTRQAAGLRRKGFKSMAEARRALNQMVVDVEDKIRRSVVFCWSALVEKYREHMLNQNLSAKTVETHWLCLKSHTFEDWGDRLIDTITTQEIRELVQRRVGHRSPSHQKNLLKFIRGAFRFAVECDHIKRNPTPEMKFRIGDKIKKVLTEDQVRLFLNKAKEFNSEWYYHWCLALYTGMRSGELYALTWDKVNFETRQILVDCAWNNVDGFKETKSGHDRIIEIAPNLLLILKELKLQSVDTNFVLPRIDKWDKGEQARELRLFLMSLGLPTIRFHDLRATWATIMLSRGVEPVKVLKLGGWRDLKTAQIYLRKAGVDVRGSTDVLDLHNPSNESASILSFTAK